MTHIFIELVPDRTLCGTQMDDGAVTGEVVRYDDAGTLLVVDTCRDCLRAYLNLELPL